MKSSEFKKYRIQGKTLKNIAYFIGVSEKTAKRWNKEYKKNTLIRPHGLANKKGNKKSTINKNKILNDYLKLSKELTKDGKCEPYNFSYYVSKKINNSISLSSFKKIMKDNFVASPWARKATKKAFNEILKKYFRKESNADKKVLIKQIIENNSKIYFRKSRPDNEGAIMEIDASKDYWLKQKQSHLYAGYDPTTKKLWSSFRKRKNKTSLLFVIQSFTKK